MLTEKSDPAAIGPHRKRKGETPVMKYIALDIGNVCVKINPLRAAAG